MSDTESLIDVIVKNYNRWENWAVVFIIEILQILLKN